MPKYVKDDETVSGVFRALVEQSGETIPEIHEATKIPEPTLYSLYNRNSRKADMKMLRVLAEHFGEDLEIFCGMSSYQKKSLSREDEMLLQQIGTLTESARLQVMGLVMKLRSDPKNVERLI